MDEPFGIEIVRDGEAFFDKGLQVEPVKGKADSETCLVSHSAYMQGGIQSGADDFQFGIQIVDYAERFVFESFEQKIVLGGREMEHGVTVKNHRSTFR